MSNGGLWLPLRYCLESVADAEDLVGKWVSDPADLEPIPNYGLVSLDFSGVGTLVYTIRADEKRELIFLTYRVEDDVLITDQPLAPKQERTKFNIDLNGKLSLQYGERRWIFFRDSSAI